MQCLFFLIVRHINFENSLLSLFELGNRDFPRLQANEHKRHDSTSRVNLKFKWVLACGLFISTSFSSPSSAADAWRPLYQTAL